MKKLLEKFWSSGIVYHTVSTVRYLALLFLFVIGIGLMVKVLDRIFFF